MDANKLQAKYFNSNSSNTEPAYMKSFTEKPKEETNTSIPAYMQSFTEKPKEEEINTFIPAYMQSFRTTLPIVEEKEEKINYEENPCIDSDDEIEDIFEERKLNKNDPNAKSWYQNWITEEQEPENGENTKKKKKGSSGIKTIVGQYCSNWEDSPTDIAVFFLCLSALLKPKLDKKDKVFSEELIINAYHYGEYAFAAYKAEKKNVIKSLGFLPSDNFIEGNWDKSKLKEAPAWYVAIDTDEEAVILSLRGTKEKDDIFVDLAAQYSKWEEGYVHQGFLNSLKKLEPMVLPVVKKQMEKNKGYKLRIVGHSMGAAVASLVTLKWAKEYPNWDIHGFGYATPCVISHHLVKRSNECFTTFVHHFDAVSRISMGSIEDLHHAMRLFVKKMKEQYDHSLKILRTLNFALCSSNKKIKGIINEIDVEITNKLSQIEHTDSVTHLFPAGKTYQLWREKRGANFKAWQMYQSTWLDYGRVFFSASMLKDHGSAKYRSGFENMLSISITERKIWKGLPKSKKQLVKEYWYSYPKGEVNDLDFDISVPIENMKRNSKFKTKAFRKGLIRPFLFLVSMSPLRRAAIAHLLGMNMAPTYWYGEFDAHHEAYYILKTSGKGLQYRGNTTGRNVIPVRHDSNWHMILSNCGKKVKSGQKKYLSKDVTNLLKGTDKGFRETINECRKPNSKVITELEEKIMLIFFSLTDVDAKNQVFEPVEPPEDLKESKEYKDIIEQLKSQGFTQESCISRLALQTIQDSSSKRANEVYSWGAVLREKDEKTRKRALESAGALGLAGFVCLTAFPLLVVAPPVALLPLGIAAGLGGIALNKPMQGALVAIIAGCLQQRVALASKHIFIDNYYPDNLY